MPSSTGAMGSVPATWYAFSYPLPLQIQTQNAAEGTYTITITGTAGSLTHTATATLEVQGASTPPGFTGSISPTTATLTVGQSANFNITLNSENGAAGAVSLQCLNLPAGTSCTFSPSSPTLPSNGSVSDTLTVQVSSMPAAAPPVPSLPGNRPGMPPHVIWLFAASLACLGLGMELRRRRLNAAASLAGLLCVVWLFLASAACGGGGGYNPPSNPTPTPGMVSIVVQAKCPGVSAAQTLGTLSITVN